MAISSYSIDDTTTTWVNIWTAGKTQLMIDTATSGLASSLKTPVGSLAELKSINTTNATLYPDKCMLLVESMGLFRLDRDSTDAANDVDVVDCDA